MMPSRKEVEKEISKINKEIANLKWSLKNEVLTQEKRAQKIQKIKDLKKTRTELTQQREGWRGKGFCLKSSRYLRDPEQVSHPPGG